MITCWRCDHGALELEPLQERGFYNYHMISRSYKTHWVRQSGGARGGNPSAFPRRSSVRGTRGAQVRRVPPALIARSPSRAAFAPRPRPRSLRCRRPRGLALWRGRVEKPSRRWACTLAAAAGGAVIRSVYAGYPRICRLPSVVRGCRGADRNRCKLPLCYRTDFRPRNE